MSDEKELASATLQLLQRTELKGSEVGVFVDVCNWLQGKTMPPPPPAPEPDTEWKE